MLAVSITPRTWLQMLRPSIDCSRSDTEIVVITPPLPDQNPCNKDQRLPIEVWGVRDVPIKWREPFHYKSDPVITSVNPLEALLRFAPDFDSLLSSRLSSPGQVHSFVLPTLRYYILIIMKAALNFSGGIRVTVSGSSLDSVYEPHMTITATASDIDDLEFRAAAVSRKNAGRYIVVQSCKSTRIYLIV